MSFVGRARQGQPTIDSLQKEESEKALKYSPHDLAESVNNACWIPRKRASHSLQHKMNEKKNEHWERGGSGQE
ncbi:hypothetical protein Y1Q_0009695 [Alligator mississippiensis]|uniref:Uncharacterized protein n=1 Tax=Alligator mississippiensis TaxID=8496 RepID=A0A151MWG9_ALLMI|nr:hypothetical protein Y1Q_0009695 [Alligator mississippiensis]